jgi:Tfp pilus assembly protein PilV
MLGRLSRLMRSKRYNLNRRYKGLSIIEVAMASVLLIVAMVPILRALTKAHMFSSEIERKTQSLVFAQNKIDEIRARSVYNWSSFTASNVSLGNSYLCNVTDTTASNLKTITVSVGNDGDGSGSLSSGEVEVTLATYVARRW